MGNTLARINYTGKDNGKPNKNVLLHAGSACFRLPLLKGMDQMDQKLPPNGVPG